MTGEHTAHAQFYKAFAEVTHVSVIFKDEVWATREGRQGVGCGIFVAKSVDGSYFALKKDYGSKVSLIQELVEKVIGNVAQEGTTAAVGEQMVVGGVPIDVIAVPYEEAFGAKCRKCVSPRKVVSVTSMECAGAVEAGGAVADPNMVHDVSKRVLHARRATSAKTESVVTAVASPEHVSRKWHATSSVSSDTKPVESSERVTRKRGATSTVTSDTKPVKSSERVTRTRCAASTVTSDTKPVKSSERVTRTRCAASTITSDTKPVKSSECVSRKRRAASTVMSVQSVATVAK